jgi:hypothetical protein
MVAGSRTKVAIYLQRGTAAGPMPMNGLLDERSSQRDVVLPDREAGVPIVRPF